MASPSAKKWPCVFAGQFVKEQVNPRLYEQDPKTPFGAFQKAWRQLHCATINPYGSEVCPYAEEDCALAFLMTAQDALEARTSKIGLFRTIAQKRGWARAENKPLARERIVRTDGHESRASDLRRGPGERAADGVGRLGVRPSPEPGGLAGDRSVGVRSTSHRPQSIGSLLRGDDEGPRTHPYRRHESEEAAHDDGDGGDPVPESSSQQLLGDESPPGDPGLHQGGE